MAQVTINLKKYNDLETRSIEELLTLRELAVSQYEWYIKANPTIPVSRFSVFKSYRDRYNQQVAILDTVIAEKQKS